jgi:hypothetical protein
MIFFCLATLALDVTVVTFVVGWVLGEQHGTDATMRLWEASRDNRAAIDRLRDSKHGGNA